MLGKPFETECLANRCVKMFGKPCDEVQCVLEGRMHIVTFCKPLTFSVFSKFFMRCPLQRRFAVIVDNACFQTKGVNCRLDETRAKWP